MSSSRDLTSRLRQSVWNGSVPLEIRLKKGDCITYDESDPYLIQFPRLSYLGFLLPRLHAFFSSSLIYPDVAPWDGWLSYEDVPLRWHYPLGLLYDLYSGAEPAQPSDGAERKEHGVEEERNSLPWQLTLHFSEYPREQLVKLDADGKHLHDLFINSVKEADFLRNGNGKTIMSLNKEDSTQLWYSVQQHSFADFNPINQKLLNPQGVDLRHIPIKLYLPHTSTDPKEKEGSLGSLRVLQSLIRPSLSPRQPQTLGTALKQVIPSLFPSTRTSVLAQPVLHGAALPLTASVEDLLRTAAYLDGWLHIAIAMMG